MLLVRIFPSLLQDEGAEWPGEEREALRRARTGNKDRCWRHGTCGCTVGDNIGEICFVFHSIVHVFGRSEKDIFYLHGLGRQLRLQMFQTHVN